MLVVAERFLPHCSEEFHYFFSQAQKLYHSLSSNHQTYLFFSDGTQAIEKDVLIRHKLWCLLI